LAPQVETQQQVHVLFAQAPRAPAPQPYQKRNVGRSQQCENCQIRVHGYIPSLAATPAKSQKHRFVIELPLGFGAL
jgi:hypothetical protein